MTQRNQTERNQTEFRDFRLKEPILRAIEACGYKKPTPIQVSAIPPLMTGRDLLGVAGTGTGKTAAFALPILHRLASGSPRRSARAPRVLVLTPTRELAAQVHQSFRDYGRGLPLESAVVFGGVPQGPQTRELRRGIDILIATPGRLLDLIDQDCVDLRDIEIFVLDEADRMLDMGFLPAVRRVIDRLPRVRQSVMFSATMPASIQSLTLKILHDPVRVEIRPVDGRRARIEQRVFLVAKADKSALLRSLLTRGDMRRTIVFTRTKHGADRVARHLKRSAIAVHAIHGDKSQGQRERALEAFRRGDSGVLVATDIAARGIDIDGVTHIVNYDLPNVVETYVHRIGRTARAGRAGIALSFCDPGERALLRDIEAFTREPVLVVRDHGFEPEAALVAAAVAAPQPARQRRRRPRAVRAGR